MPGLHLRITLPAAAVLCACCACAHEPVRLPDGEPLVCIYYFGHWWEPWRTSDQAVADDLQMLRGMGVNTVCLDHEWSQAIAGDWRWLDREHRLAKQAGMGIIPWLSLKSFGDVALPERLALAEQWYGTRIPVSEDQSGERAGVLIYDQQTIRFGASYALDYLERYRDETLLHLRWGEGTARPVICLGVETAWRGGFDERTNRRFRSYLRQRYGTVEALNDVWGTDYGAFDAIDPRDTRIFDYEGAPDGNAEHPVAVEDHVEFRARMISVGLGAMARRVRQQHPEVLVLAEIPYQYGSEHPHARAYRITYGANPSANGYADIVLFRCTGPLNAAEIEALKQARERTGQRFILTYRTYSDWDIPAGTDEFDRAVRTYARQAAALAGGFGLYSWNEMVDTHVAYAPDPPRENGWTQERAERATGLLAAMVERYRGLVGEGQ